MPTLTPGTYVTNDPFLARVTFTVPDGWAGNIGGPYAVFLGDASGPDRLLVPGLRSRSTQIHAATTITLLRPAARTVGG